MLSSDKIKKIIKTRQGREMMKPNNFSGLWLVRFPTAEHARKAMVTMNKVLGYRAELWNNEPTQVGVFTSIR